MRIATWNVNSLNVRLPHLLDWLKTESPDIVALQELKMDDPAFPHAALNAAGYQAIAAGQRTYNGVAILAKVPVQGSDIVMNIPEFPDDQKRVLTATYPLSDGTPLRVVNVYVPNGQSVGSDKYAYKLAWLAALGDFIADQLQRYPNLVVLGDFNIAPADRDVFDADKWGEGILCSAQERQAYQSLLGLGLADCFRLHEQDAGHFSWWDYRQGAFRRDHGLRIDLILASAPVAQRCDACTIDKIPRQWERPSDHTPVVASLR